MRKHRTLLRRLWSQVPSPPAEIHVRFVDKSPEADTNGTSVQEAFVITQDPATSQRSVRQLPLAPHTQRAAGQTPYNSDR